MFVFFLDRCAEKASTNNMHFANLYLNGTYVRLMKSKRFSLNYLSRRNLSKNTKGCSCLVASTFAEPPFVMKSPSSNSPYDGLEMRIINVLADYHKFKITYFPVFEYVSI